MHKEIIRWYSRHKRELPWRDTTPWGILVSEFMLQQTPVSRVLPIWNQWMERWPTPKDLANTPRADVIRAWGNLGYPRRAIRLHETACKIMSEHEGVVPDNEVLLRSLPGIGEYTAAAVVSFAFKKKSLVLDTNIRRLFSRAIEGNEYPPMHITNLERKRRASLIPKQAATWAAAIMELGALICTAKDPGCEKCPIRKSCSWRKKGFPKTLTLKTSQVWHGSSRQCRGVIMKALRSYSSMTYETLKANWPDESQFENAIQSLVEDRLIIKHKNMYQLIE